MQRKRTRGVIFGDTVELGGRLLPMNGMRKLTMKTIVKYATFAIIVIFIYIVYQKISQASRPPAEDDSLPGRKTDDHDEEDSADHDKERQENIERRVKEEVNKVFEQLKLKQKEKEDLESKRDVFEEYKIENKIDKKDKDVDQIRQAVKHILNEQGFEENIKEDDVPTVDIGDNIHNVDKLNDADTAVDDNANDGFLDDPNVDNSIFEVDEDPEKEKAELDVEKEIEEKLAGAFKDAVNKAADEVAEEKAKEEIEDAKAGIIDTRKDKVKIQDLQHALNKKEFKLAVDNMAKGLSPLEVQRMNEKARRDALRHENDHEFPPFVTAARRSSYVQVQQLVASIQHMMPGRQIVIYDLDLDKAQKKQLMSYCGVKVHYFMKEIFPRYVKDLDKNHWKPLVIQTALAEFGHLIWVNPHYRLGSSEIAPIVHDSHERGIVVVGQSASYTTFSATHPDMLNFIPTNKEKLSYHPHVEIRAILIHNTPEVHDKVMKVFTACALEETCLAPKGAKWQCKFDFTGRKYADCHRYDESALNILLKNWYDYDMSKYVIRSSVFRPYDKTYRPKIKTCRDEKSIRDNEL